MSRRITPTTFGGIDLGESGSSVFEMTSESDDADFAYTVPGGAEVILPASGTFVVVRRCPGSGFEQVHVNAREAANRAIDVYYAEGGRPLALAHKDSPYVVGWGADGGRRIRAVGRGQQAIRFRVTGVVRDAQGNVMHSPPPPPKTWHECLRYYRMSEASTDLYDSFRCLYLAIESLLSQLFPIRKGKDGDKGDKGWLLRAVREAAEVVDLSGFAPPPSGVDEAGDAVEAIHTELYVHLRTALFHGKVGRETWTPQEWTSRAYVIEARYRYALMYRALAAKYMDVRYPDGGITQGAWENVQDQLSIREVVYASNDPTRYEDEPKGAHQLAPAGGAYITLSTTPAVGMHADWVRGVEGIGSGRAVREAIGEVLRFGSLLDGEPSVVENLRAPLVVGDDVDLSLVLLAEGRNYGQPKQDFET